MPKLSIIIPCYFNEKNIPITTLALKENEQNFPEGLLFEYVFVDDGSHDHTWEELKTFYNHYPEQVKIIKLVSNVGSYMAVLAGMKYATGDCNVVIACDLQDPIELMPEMYNFWLSGQKLVIANRQDREEKGFGAFLADFFQRMIRKFGEAKIPAGGFDYVLFDRKLRDEVVRMNENNTNTLYLLTWQGYTYLSIPYTRKKRTVGKSKWTFKKKLKLFVDSFVSFSFFPIRMISVTGLILGLCAFLYGIFILVAYLFHWIELAGWTSMMAVLLFVSSFQMIAIGILGEYVWRSLDASRKRANYLVDEFIGKTPTAKL
jgi:glycosyltransferase involved in cell wall biosynthesis